MDIVDDYNDLKAARGIQILQGGVEDRTQSNFLVRSAGKSGDLAGKAPAKGADASDTEGGAGRSVEAQAKGLELGRRLLIVLKTDTNGGQGPTPPAKGKKAKSQTSAVRVVDHAASQKEAIRRLFDAQVLLMSYEEQLQEKEEQNEQLTKQLKKLMVSQARLLHSTSDLQSQGVMVEESPSPTASKAKATGQAPGAGAEAAAAAMSGKPMIPSWMRNDERSRNKVDALKAQVLDMINKSQSGSVDKTELGEACWELGVDFAMRWAGSPDDELIKQNKVLEAKARRIQKESLQEGSMLRQHIKKVERKYKELQTTAKQMGQTMAAMKTQALQMLPKKGAADGPPPKPPMLAEAEATAASLPGSPQAAKAKKDPALAVAPKPVNPLAQQIVAGWMRSKSSGAPPPWAEPEPAKEPTSPTSPVGRGSSFGGGSGGGNNEALLGVVEKLRQQLSEIVPELKRLVDENQRRYNENQRLEEENRQLQTYANQLEAWGQAQAFAGNRGSVADGSAGMNPHAVWGSFSIPAINTDDHMDPQPGLGTKPNLLSMANDETLGISIEQDQLDQMDSEIFEPLNSFDEDLRQMMIEAVDEKVRRILSLNMDNYKGGKLPFGMIPTDGAKGQEEVYRLEALVQQLRDEIEALKQDNERLKRELEDAQKQPRKQGERPAQQVTMKREQGGEEMKAFGGSRRSIEPEEETRDFGPGVDVGAEIMKATQALKEKIKELEETIRKLEAKIRKLENKPEVKAPEPKVKIEKAAPVSDNSAELAEIKELKARIKALEEELATATETIAKKDAKIRKLSDELDEMKNAPKEKKVEVKKDAPPPNMKPLYDANRNLRRAEELLRSLLLRIADFTGMKSTAKGQKAVEDLIGKYPGKMEYAEKEEGGKISIKAMTAFEEWVKEGVKAIDDFKPPVVEVQVEAEDTGPPVDNTPPPVAKPTNNNEKELIDLRNRIAKQQDEISRLLLIIDELRKRLEQVQVEAKKKGPQMMGDMKMVMSSAGLREMLEVGCGPKLSGVFERLYQDAIQRITRYGLIRERVAAANKAYSQVVTAITATTEESPEEVPDFERLQTTASSALRGMWYHTDYLFRHACDYAMHTGVEASLLKSQRASLGDVLEGGAAEDTEQYPGWEQDMSIGGKINRSRNIERTPARQGQRPLKGALGSSAFAESFWQTGDSRELKKGKQASTEPGSFSSYVAALKEDAQARTDASWSRAEKTQAERKLGKGKDSLGALTASNFLSSQQGLPVTPTRGGGHPLSASQSLPALPAKGRSLFQGTSGEHTPTSPLSQTMRDSARQM